MNTWRIEEAQRRLGEVVSLALDEEPQRVTRGAEAVVVIEAGEYARLKARPSAPEKCAEPMPLFEFLQNSPLAEAVAAGEFEFYRSDEEARDISFD